uniref:Uncharacterized protein n=1 Tax=Oryza nivara TaxID=4536 RepID=A0A0E0GWR6_ORYNI
MALARASGTAGTRPASASGAGGVGERRGLLPTRCTPCQERRERGGGRERRGKEKADVDKANW